MTRAWAMLFCAAIAAAQTPVVIGTRHLTKLPIDRDIYGVTLEHIGQGFDTMRAELLQDNSFEGLQEFFPTTENWAEGKVNDKAFWWHSGYELHPWRAFGNNRPDAANTTFGSNLVNGIHGKLIINNSGKSVGIAQDGIPLRAGMSYRFEGYFDPTPYPARKPGATAAVTLALHADAERQKLYAKTIVAVEQGGMHKYSAVLVAPETTANATFTISLDSQGSVAMDVVSLRPADNIDGWRKDVVAAIQDMGFTSFRYPGGVFASFADWRTMVGPKEQRVPYTNPNWGGLDPNDVGTDEFLRLMELMKGDPMMCVNVITGTPELAAGWVEYCNGSEKTHYGQLRARNGHPKPYGVKHWELDNETMRRFTAAQYGDECKRYAAAMRAVDPTIKLMAVAYFWRDQDTLPQLLDRAASSIDYLAVRAVDDNELSKFEDFARKYSTAAHPIRIASTEWRSRFRKNIWMPLQIEGSLRKLNSSWGYALEMARTFQEFQKESDFVRLAMYPAMTNLYGEDLMQVSKSAIAYTASGKVMKLLSDIRGYVVASGAAADKTEVNAVVDEQAKRLVCTIVRGNSSPEAIQLDLRAWKSLRAGKVISLSSDNLNNRDDFKTPDTVKRTESEATGEAGMFQVRVPGYSVSKVVFSLP